MLYLLIGALLTIGAKSQSCSTDADCDATASDGLGVCIEDAGEMICGECNTDADCESNDFWTNFWTIFGTTDLICSDPESTGVNGCYPPSCNISADCDTNYDCIGTFCFLPPTSPPTTSPTASANCSTVADCIASASLGRGACVQGIDGLTCSACKTADDCNDNNFWTTKWNGATNLECYDPVSVQTGVNGCYPLNCTTIDDCESGYYCINTFCVHAQEYICLSGVTYDESLWLNGIWKLTSTFNDLPVYKRETDEDAYLFNNDFTFGPYKSGDWMIGSNVDVANPSGVVLYGICSLRAPNGDPTTACDNNWEIPSSSGKSYSIGFRGCIPPHTTHPTSQPSQSPTTQSPTTQSPTRSSNLITSQLETSGVLRANSILSLIAVVVVLVCI